MDKKYFALLVAVAVVAGGTGYLISHPLAFPVEGIPCEAKENTAFHIHAHLELWKGGKPIAIPAGIGVVGGCFYWLHTHTPDGLIHVEAPEDRHFTLGQFFAIWGAQAPVPDHDAAILIDRGQGFVPYQGSWKDLILTNHERIAIGLKSKVPQDFAFPEGL